MKVIAIVQARIGSTRLPGKVLKKILGKTVLDMIIEKLAFAKTLSEVVVAIPDTSKDKELLEHCKKAGYKIYSGSEDDVLDRYYQAAKKFGADVVVRITSDNPLIDPKIVDQVVGKYLAGGHDYVSNCPLENQSYPVGSAVEVFSVHALEKSKAETTQKDDLEHVTLYIRKNPSKFRIFYVQAEGKLKRPDVRITLDTPEDFEFITKVCEKLSSLPLIHTEDIIGLVEREPKLLEINTHVKQKTYTKPK